LHAHTQGTANKQRCQQGRRRSTNRISRKTARLSRSGPVGFYQGMMPWTSSDCKGCSKALFMTTIVSHKTRASFIHIIIDSNTEKLSKHRLTWCQRLIRDDHKRGRRGNESVARVRRVCSTLYLQNLLIVTSERCQKSSSKVLRQFLPVQTW
jgi:hypothetical protein